MYITLDSETKISVICASTASHLGVYIQKTNQNLIKADGSTPLEIISEIHFDVTLDNITLHIEVLVMKNVEI